MATGYLPIFFSFPTAPAVLGSRSIPSAVQRFFTDFIAASSAHISIPTVTATGDYQITADVYFSGSVARIWGRSQNFNSRLFIDTNGSVQWGAEDTTNNSLSAAANSVPTNRWSTITVSRSGSAGSITINGTVVATGTVGTGTASINVLGRNGTSYSTAIYANVDFVMGFTQVGNPTGNPTYQLRESFVGSVVVANANASLGAELWDGSTLSWASSDSAFAIRGEGVATLNSTRQYLIRYDVSISSGSVRYSTSSHSESFVTSSGTYEALLPIGETNPRFRSGSSGAEATISNISIREAPGYGTAENITMANANEYTQVSDGWVGDELWVAPFTVPPQITDNSNGTYSANAPGSTVNVVPTTTSPIAGSTYRTQLNVTERSAGLVTVRLGNVNGVGRGAAGLYDEDITASASNSFNLQFTGNAIATAGINSIKRLLRNAA